MQAIASFLEQVPLLLVLGAGFVTLLSPCGYALIPAYISYQLGSRMTVRKALRGSLTAVLGIFLVFGAAGLVVGTASFVVRGIIPHLTLVSAMIILAIGLSKALEFNIPLIGLSPIAGAIRPAGFFTYGVSYAFAASGCTFPIFLTVILYASLFPGLGALITMLTYGFGIAIPLIATSIFVARANQTLLTRIARATPRIHRISGLVLVAAGIYLAYYYYANFLAKL